MHVLFVNYTDFQGPSGIHIFHLANALCAAGVSSTVIVPHRPEDVTIFGEPRFHVLPFHDAQKEIKGSVPSLIHAWTPRESTRWMTQRLSRRLGIPYVVHMEDNEEAIAARYLDTPVLALRLWRRLRLSIGPKDKPVPHPRRYKAFLAKACGATLLTDSLTRFVPAHVPTIVIWPACEDDVFSLSIERDMALRDHLGISSDDIVVTYPGNVHQANVLDVENLYNAVLLARKRGIKASLIRIGQDHVPFSTDFSSKAGTCFFELGDLPPKKIPAYLRAADILVQPGHPGSFDECRFPSKLPMFLASGRPVILANVNLAQHLTHGLNAVIIKNGTAEEMADAVERLGGSPEKRAMIGKAGRAFARQHFSWTKTADEVLAFYNLVLNRESER